MKRELRASSKVAGRHVSLAGANCHSERTTWPWYSYVAPVSWLIESDVSKARGHMNLSVWDQYTVEKREELPGELAAAVRSRQMPPPRYTLMHSSSTLSK